MDLIPHKNLTAEEIDAVVRDTSRMDPNDPQLDMALVLAGPLYGALWTLGSVAIVLAREHMSAQPNAEIFLEHFKSFGLRYVGKALLAIGVELDTIDNLTPEESQNVVQVFFERIVASVNEEIMRY